MLGSLANPTRTDDSTIVCDEEGSLDPVSWTGSVASLGDDYRAVLRYQEERVLKVEERRGRSLFAAETELVLFAYLAVGGY